MSGPVAFSFSLFPAILLLLASSSFALLMPRSLHGSRCAVTSSLFGLPEWRDKVPADEQTGQRPILLLPFVAKEALLQGQSRDVRLKEGRFYDLFQDCMDDYESIVGMVLMGDDGLLTDMPLCEIRDFDVEAGFRGKVTVSVTLCAVGRAKLDECTQMKPIMMGTCSELVDEGAVDIRLANEIVNDIETTVRDMNVAHRYSKAMQLAASELPTMTETSLMTASGHQRSIEELTAASWASFVCCSGKSYVYKAISTTKLIERLELGLKALLDDKYQTGGAISNELDGDIGFQ